jgi:hypothetical protein
VVGVETTLTVEDIEETEEVLKEAALEADHPEEEGTTEVLNINNSLHNTVSTLGNISNSSSNIMEISLSNNMLIIMAKSIMGKIPMARSTMVLTVLKLLIRTNTLHIKCRYKIPDMLSQSQHSTV